MVEELFLEPLVATVGLLILVNFVNCCVGFRRIRRIEQRVHALENIQIAAPAATRAEQTQPTTYPPTTYIQPATYATPVSSYTYFQTQPSAPTYYPQDPQAVYR